MIRNSQDKKITPKELARELILNALSTARGYWTERDYIVEGMTDREIKLVNIQLQKEADRIAKKYGYESSWTN